MTPTGRAAPPSPAMQDLPKSADHRSLWHPVSERAFLHSEGFDIALQIVATKHVSKVMPLSGGLELVSVADFKVWLQISSLDRPRQPFLLGIYPFSFAGDKGAFPTEPGRRVHSKLKEWDTEGRLEDTWDRCPLVGQILFRGLLLAARARDLVFAVNSGATCTGRLPLEDCTPELVDPQSIPAVAVDGTGARLVHCQAYPFRQLYVEAAGMLPGLLMKECLVTIAKNGRVLRVRDDPAVFPEAIARARASGMLATQVPEELLHSENADSRFVGVAPIARGRRRM